MPGYQVPLTTVDANTTINNQKLVTTGFNVGKNLIVNGGFDIWQRGATRSNATHDTYTADQWININDSVGSTTVSQIDISSQNIGLRYAARFEKTSGSSNRFVFINLAEGALSCVGKQVTLSFWIRKGPGLTSGITTSIGTRANKYGPVYDSGDFGIANSEISSTTFTRFTTTFNITSSTANNSANLFELEFTAIQAGGAGVYFEIAGVQLEIGSVATPFSRSGVTLQGELAACQKYYMRFGGDQTYQLLSFGIAHSATRAYIPIRFPVTMRATPTSIDWSTLALQRDPSQSIYSVTSLANLNNNGSGRDVFGLDVTIGSSSLSIGTPYILMTNGSTSAYIGFSAEF